MKVVNFKGELQRENKLISYERGLKMLENNMYITGVGPTVLELLSLRSGKGITEEESRYFRNFRKYEARFTENDVTSDKSQFPNFKN